MATSLNGWPIISTPPVTRPGPDNRNPSGFANTDVADVLSAFMWWYHTELEPVTEWGGHRDPGFNSGLKNSASRSNHLSGTAQDIEWTRHPFIRGRSNGDSFTSAQLRLLAEFDARLGGIIRFGYTFGDDMHTEIAPGTSPARVAEVAARVRRSFVPPRDLDEIRAYQRIVGVPVDGMHGRGTVAAIRAHQRLWGVPTSGLWDVATSNAWDRRVRAANSVSALLETFDYPATPAGVGQYQKDNGLGVDEMAGPATRRHLEASMKQLDRIEKKLDTVLDEQKTLWKAVRAVPRRTIRQRLVTYKEEYGGVAPRVEQILQGLTTRSVEDVQLSRETAEAVRSDAGSADVEPSDVRAV